MLGWLVFLSAFPLLLLLVSCAKPVDPYFEDITDLQDEMIPQLDQIMDDFDEDARACERALFSTGPCDRMINNLEEVADLMDRYRTKLMALNPPSEAQSWHSNYIALFSDASDSFSDAVDAYYAGDADGFLAFEDDFNSFIEREDSLGEEFERIQEEMGAE